MSGRPLSRQLFFVVGSSVPVSLQFSDVSFLTMKNLTLFKPVIKIFALPLIRHFKATFFLDIIFLFDYYKLFYVPASVKVEICVITDA